MPLQLQLSRCTSRFPKRERDRERRRKGERWKRGRFGKLLLITIIYNHAHNDDDHIVAFSCFSCSWRRGGISTVRSTAKWKLPKRRKASLSLALSLLRQVLALSLCCAVLRLISNFDFCLRCVAAFLLAHFVGRKQNGDRDTDKEKDKEKEKPNAVAIRFAVRLWQRQQ